MQIDVLTAIFAAAAPFVILVVLGCGGKKKKKSSESETSKRGNDEDQSKPAQGPLEPPECEVDVIHLSVRKQKSKKAVEEKKEEKKEEKEEEEKKNEEEKEEGAKELGRRSAEKESKSGSKGSSEKKSASTSPEKKDTSAENGPKPHLTLAQDGPLLFAMGTTSQVRVPLKNTHDKKIMYKVKFSDAAYQAHPVYGTIEPGKTLDLVVTRQKSNVKEAKMVIVNSENTGGADDMKKIAESLKLAPSTGGQITVQLIAK